MKIVIKAIAVNEVVLFFCGAIMTCGRSLRDWVHTGQTLQPQQQACKMTAFVSQFGLMPLLYSMHMHNRPALIYCIRLTECTT